MHLSFCKYLVQSNLRNVNPSAFLLANTPDREIEWNVSNKSFPTDFKQIRIGNETSLVAAAAATFDWSVGSSSPFELHNCGHPWIHVSHAITLILTRMLYSDCQTCCTYQLDSKVLIAFIFIRAGTTVIIAKGQIVEYLWLWTTIQINISSCVVIILIIINFIFTIIIIRNGWVLSSLIRLWNFSHWSAVHPFPSQLHFVHLGKIFKIISFERLYKPYFESYLQ